MGRKFGISKRDKGRKGNSEERRPKNEGLRITETSNRGNEEIYTLYNRYGDGGAVGSV